MYRETAPTSPTGAARPASVDDLQVVVPGDPESPTIAGVPAAIRAAHAAATLSGVTRVLLATETSGVPTSWHRWLDRLPVPCAHVATSPSESALIQVLDAAAPVLVLARDTIPDTRLVDDALSARATSTRPTMFVSGTGPVATLYPEARALIDLARGANDLSAIGVPANGPIVNGDGAGTPRASTAIGGGSQPRDSLVWAALVDPRATRCRVPADAWIDASDRAGAAHVERRLLAALPQASDGYLARFDRRISIALSRLLIRTPLTPSAITALSLLAGLVGAAVLARVGWGTAVVGVVLLWLAAVLDGCDGEVARLKLLTSRWGGWFDLATDHVTHLATFLAILLHVHRRHPSWDLATPGWLLLAGVVTSMAAVGWVLRRPSAGARSLTRVYERLASRDYVYALMVVAACDHLEWFIWAAAVGAHVFWITLWICARPSAVR